jgi:hypothetical protein
MCLRPEGGFCSPDAVVHVTDMPALSKAVRWLCVSMQVKLSTNCRPSRPAYGLLERLVRDVVVLPIILSAIYLRRTPATVKARDSLAAVLDTASLLLSDFLVQGDKFRFRFFFSPAKFARAAF